MILKISQGKFFCMPEKNQLKKIMIEIKLLQYLMDKTPSGAPLPPRTPSSGGPGGVHLVEVLKYVPGPHPEEFFSESDPELFGLLHGPRHEVPHKGHPVRARHEPRELDDLAALCKLAVGCNRDLAASLEP